MTGINTSDSIDYSALISHRITGTDTKGRPVTGKIIGRDNKPVGHPEGNYFVVKPDDPHHDPLTVNSHAYIDIINSQWQLTK